MLGKDTFFHSLWIAVHSVLINSLYFLTLFHTPIRREVFLEKGISGW
jgi:hypothetical protein